MARRADGEGTIVQRGDGRWVAAIALGGKRRWLYGKTRRDVVEKLSGLQQDAQAGRLVEASRQSVDAYLTTWLDVVKPQLRPSTWASYEELLRLHIRPTLGTLRLQALRPLHLVRLYATRTIDGVGARRVQMAHRVLHKALGDAVKWRALSTNPAASVTPPRPQREERTVWTVEETQRFLAHVHQQHRAWDALWTFLLGTGCREGEALALRWADVDLDAGTVRVVRTVARVHNRPVEGAPKTTSGRRSLALPSFALAALHGQRRCQAERRLAAGPAWAGADRVFTTTAGTIPTASALRKAFRATCRAAGVLELRIHDLRHAHATLAVAYGADVKALQRRLGHATLTMTLGLYAHAAPTADRSLADALQAALVPPASDTARADA